MWRQKQVSEDFKEATIVHLYKKRNCQHCDNHRRILPLKVAGKIFAHILLNRLKSHLEQGLSPKASLHRHRGNIDMIFASRQLQEKCHEMRTHLYSIFIDLTQVFEMVNREGLWRIMQKIGCPQRFTHTKLQFHDGETTRVTDNGAVSAAFAATNGVKQGCVLAPTLFSLMFSAILVDACADEHPGSCIAYWLDEQLINQPRMHTQLRVSAATIPEFLFTDDCALGATTEADLPSLPRRIHLSHGPAQSNADPQTTSQYSSPVTTTTTAVAATTTISDGDSLLHCPHCDYTFTSRISLVGRLRIHSTETAKLVPGAPTHSRDHRLHCPHCPRAFTHRIGLFSHMRIHENLRLADGGCESRYDAGTGCNSCGRGDKRRPAVGQAKLQGMQPIFPALSDGKTVNQLKQKMTLILVRCKCRHCLD
ncbi:unnamed protein product [Schistocephalus solidus]|uniref:C2H2-type domain-containing protein n=1 Tax=Schistocephalus solidus TaxID=70667 RepID=A0A183T724_SCHSO|nr:unnamed protein product [Schistocephalus solidus]